MAVLRQIAANDSKKMERLPGAWKDLKNATNEVYQRLVNIHRTVGKVGMGDLTDYEFYKKVGRRSENDAWYPGSSGCTKPSKSCWTTPTCWPGPQLKATRYTG